MNNFSSQNYFIKVINYPKTVICLTFLLVIFLSAGLVNLEISNDFRVYLSKSNPQLKAFEKFEANLDVDMQKIPPHLLKTADPIFEFNKAIIEATHHLCVAYKPNTAFYEAYGLKGWKSLEKTIHYLNQKYPEIYTIADAKRGDIGNTSTMYAKAFFDDLGFDSVTVAPYMGKDSVEPFLAFEDKHTILLALTSNQGAFDFQTKTMDGVELYKQVLETSKTRTENGFCRYLI